MCDVPWLMTSILAAFDEQPRLFFRHFWANDDAMKLAKGLRAALDESAVKLQ